MVNRVSSAGASVSKTLSNVGKTISGDVSGAAGTISKDVGGALGTLKKDVSGTIGNINNTGKVLNIYASILGFVTKYWYIIVAILSVVTLLIFYKLGVF